MKYISFETPKSGEKLENNEDSVFVKKLSDKNFLVSVSDGASTGVFSKEWSEHITKNFDSAWIESEENFIFGLDSLRESFKPNITRNSALRKFLMQGSYATLLSLKISKSGYFFPKFELECFAIGDVCLFIFDVVGNLEFCFPYTSKDDFNNVPDLLRSSKKLQEKTPVTIKSSTTSCKMDSLIVIATDAFSEFLYKRKNSSDILAVIREVIDCKDQDQFTNLMDRYRTEFNMHNDDVAICMIQNESGKYF